MPHPMLAVAFGLLACTGESALDSGTAADGDAGADSCALVEELPRALSATPGAALTLARRIDPDAAVAADLSTGDLVEQDGSFVWQLPDDIAVHLDEDHHATLTASRDGCPDQVLETPLQVGWPDTARVVVLSNPDVEGSADVADAYLALHDLDPAQHCTIAAADPVTLPGDDLAGFLDQLQACIDAVGPQVHTIVPVWGVPYKVSGRIADISGSGATATVSLDALMFLGQAAASATDAIWNPAWQDGDSMAGAYDPAVSWGEIVEDVGQPLYMVARIDGVDADAAIDLVDRTAEALALAEAGALAGTVYVDGRYGDTPPATDEFGSYESGEWNMWGTRTVFQDLDWYDVVWDGNDAEFGTAPAPKSCPDALYYAGWYSFGNYNDAFTWAPGAIGGHLDSCSACDIRGDRDWSAVALQRGITATFGAVNEPYVAGMPEYDQFFLYLSQGASFGEAAYQSTRIGLWMMVFVGDPLYRPVGG